MPPIQHSSSSRSAHKESDQIPSNQNYTLGDYSFRLERTSIPGSSNDKIEAICTDKDGKNARKSIQVPSSTQLLGWYVEANETEASVYILTNAVAPLIIGDIPCIGSPGLTEDKPVEQNRRYQVEIGDIPGGLMTVSDGKLIAAWGQSDTSHSVAGWVSSWVLYPDGTKHSQRGSGLGSNLVFQFDNKIVGYYAQDRFWNEGVDKFAELVPRANVELTDFAKAQSFNKAACIAWSMIYSATEDKKETLVARFAIDIEDAGGVGPDAEDGDDPGDDGWGDPDDYYDDDNDDYEDTEEYDDELYLELDKWEGEPGESFTVTITGHNGESVVVSVQPNDATEEILTYRLYAPASKDAPLTYTFTTDESWMADGIYSRAFLVTATTDETARTANDGFTLYVEEPDMLTVDTDMDEGQPGETITAYIGGHSGHTFSAVVTNAVGDIVATFSQVVPQSQYSDVELPIVLNEAWFSSNSSSETLIITATTDDNRQASAVFKMVLEPLTVSLDVDKYTAEVGEEVTWSMEAEGGNGNYQYNFFIFLDGELVRDGRWQFDNFLTYTPHSPGTYTVEGYVKDSRLSQNVKAPEDGEVIVEGEPEPEPEPEPDEITRTLYITVTGALSGRHNDPGKDPSYSYLPADKSTIADYGCGGDGGHGGGGGAGASNVVVYKFATDKADSKEITAITKRPGFGSGGGKGGKGGDGCILVYY